ncbi:uncharacterized protein [Miscanthus floridulus]|uniref:uncharacterized protein isoform X1 n=1 Tax=Miscanthus floridulus TaxID=154761 RepID=UPI003459396B
MSDPNALQTTLNALAASLKSLQASVEANSLAIQHLHDTRHPPSSSSSVDKSASGEHHQDRPPRFQKLDFPKYDGKSDPLIFINRCESYFRQQRIIPEEQVWMASYNMDDAAHLWFMQIQQEEGTPSWRRFTELLNLQFGPPLRSNPLGELMACKRTGSVIDYQGRFEALLPRAGYLTEDQKVQIFTTGLLPPLSLDVELHNPQSLAVAMSLARKLELRDQCAAAAAPPLRLGCDPQRGILPAPPPRLALPAPNTAPVPTPQPVTVEGRQVKRLSQAEMEERRRLGLCFNCNEKFGRGHNRICQRIFLLDLAVAEDDTESETDEATPGEPQISLHAIAGVCTSETMQMRITMGGTSLLALIDSGSTHNFIAEEAAAHATLPTLTQGQLRVTVANGERIQCPGVFRNAPFSINAEEFTADFYALSLAGYDVVLGPQWLATLGPILLDFGATMSFWRGGRRMR